jgi:hypothetical protein
MAQVPILKGIYSNSGPDFRTAYPVNLVPVPKSTGISEEYLRPADGIVQNGTGPGIDRGGINWNGSCYRVMGTKLVRVLPTGDVYTIGDVGAGGRVSFTYSFDRLAIASGGRLYHSTGSSLTQITDSDLGAVVDVIWVDGYFMTTDGTYLVTNDLNAPTSIPGLYGVSEADPDRIVALAKLRNEVYALNRYTIEAFDNVGGTLFPFQRIEGAQIQKGCIGTQARCVYADRIAFLGSGRNEAPGIYLGANAVANKISTSEIDALLLEYTEAELATAFLEARNDKAGQFLLVHLPDRTLVFDGAASQESQDGLLWHVLTTSTSGFSKYRASGLVWCYDKWLVGDPSSSAVGYLSQDVSSHWGQKVRWEFSTPVAYNGGKGALVNALELVALSGRVSSSDDPTIATSYSTDGVNWSQDKWVSSGATGDRAKRLVWLRQGLIRPWRVQRFKGDSSSHLTFARLEVEVEPLAV